MLKPPVLNLTKEQERKMQRSQAFHDYFGKNHTTEGMEQYYKELGLDEEEEEKPLEAVSISDKPAPEPEYRTPTKVEGSIFSMKPISAKSLLENFYPEPIYLINNILPIGLTILAGRPKIGKSFMALQMAIAVGTGSEFLGEYANEGSVAYIAFEDNDGRLSRRLKNTATKDNPPDIDFYPYDSARTEFDNLNNKGFDKLEEITGNYDMVVIDTLAQCIHVDYNDNNAITKALAPIHQLALDSETAIIFIDHLRKRGLKGVHSIDEVRGGTAKVAVADTIWSLFEEGKQRFLEITGRDVEERTIQLDFDREACSWELSGEVAKDYLSHQKEQILEFLQENKEVTNLEIAVALGKDKANIYRTLSSLIADRLIERKKVGNEYIYFIEGKKE